MVPGFEPEVYPAYTPIPKPTALERAPVIPECVPLVTELTSAFGKSRKQKGICFLTLHISKIPFMNIIFNSHFSPSHSSKTIHNSKLDGIKPIIRISAYNCLIYVEMEN